MKTEHPLLGHAAISLLLLTACSGDPSDDLADDDASETPSPTAPSQTPWTSESPAPTPTAPPTFSADAAIDQISITNWEHYVRCLSGDEPISLGGESITLETRYAWTDGAMDAAYFLQAELTDLGYNVVLEPFTCSGHTSYNVVATVPGTDPERPRIVLGAHYDSIAYENPYTAAPGADDNASGVATVLETARVLAGYRPDATVDFVLFGAEEVGLCGSTAYVENAIEEDEAIEGAVIIDMVGYYDADFGVVVETDQPSWSWAEPAFDALSAWTDLDAVLSLDPWGSDHMPFINNHIPAYLLIEQDWEDAPFHTKEDTYANIHPDLGYEVTRAVVAIVGEAAMYGESRL